MQKIYKKIQEKKKGIVHIQSTKNNTIITFTDLQGNTLFWVSAGTLGFKNSRKSTVYAAGAAAESIAAKAIQSGYSLVDVKIKGLGFGKRNALKSLAKSNLIITSLEEKTPLAHNGCRAPKKRRV